MAKRILSLAAFTAWLQTKHPRTKVGIGCDGDFCPLAKFLTQTTGIPHQVCGDSSDDAYAPALFDRDGQLVKDHEGNVQYDEANAVELPQWAKDFVKEVDHTDTSVSAQRALAIVESNTLGRAIRRTAVF